MTRADPYSPPWGNKNWDRYQGGKCQGGAGLLASPITATQLTAGEYTHVSPPSSYIARRPPTQDPFFDQWWARLTMVRQVSADGKVGAYWNDCSPIVPHVELGIGWDIFDDPDPDKRLYTYTLFFKGTLPELTPVAEGFPVTQSQIWNVNGTSALIGFRCWFPREADPEVDPEHFELIEVMPSWRNSLDGAP